MKNFFLSMLAPIVLSACATLPPNGISHARFVRTEATEGTVKAGFSAAAAVTEEAVTIPLADGTVAWQWSDRVDGSVVAHDGIALYEGLFRITPRFGLLHGVGLGFPSLSADDSYFGAALSAGLFGQIGSSFFASASYAPHFVVGGDGDSAVHFVNGELGWAFGNRVQFSPGLVVSYVASSDSGLTLPLLGLVTLTVMASP